MLDISKKAQRYLEDLQQPKLYKQVASKLLALLKDPKPSDSKHLAGFPGHFRVDTGEYRIIYRPEGMIIRIVLVGKRNDDEVYKEMQRVIG